MEAAVGGHSFIEVVMYLLLYFLIPEGIVHSMLVIVLRPAGGTAEGTLIEYGLSAFLAYMAGGSAVTTVMRI